MKGKTMSVKVHLLKRVAGPEGNFPAGRTIEVSEAEAKGLVAAGAAERIDAMQPYVVATEETTPPTPPQARGKKKEVATDKGAVKRETADEK